MTPAEKCAAKKMKTTKIRKDGRVLDAHKCLVRQHRNELGLTIRDVSAATGISNPCICDVERGSETTLTTARTLAAFFGKSIDDLWPVTQKSKRGAK